MITKFKYFLPGLTFISATAFGGDSVALNIKGKIVAAPCQISSDSIARTVPLTGAQGVQSSFLYRPGSATDWVFFDFKLACPIWLATKFGWARRLMASMRMCDATDKHCDISARLDALPIYFSLGY